MPVSRSFVVLFVMLPLLPSVAPGQLVPSPDAPPVSTAPPPPPEEESMGTLKLNVNLVDLFFTVKDKAGELVPHLTKDDCSVSEDKAPQTLKNFYGGDAFAADAGNFARYLGKPMDVLPLEQQAGASFWSASSSRRTRRFWSRLT